MHHSLVGTDCVLCVGAIRRIHDVEPRHSISHGEALHGRTDSRDGTNAVIALVQAVVEVDRERVFVVFGVAAGDDDFDQDFVRLQIFLCQSWDIFKLRLKLRLVLVTVRGGSQCYGSELLSNFADDILQNDKILHGRLHAKQRLFVTLQDWSAL